MDNWLNTIAGRDFSMKTIPELTKALNRLSDALEGREDCACCTGSGGHNGNCDECIDPFPEVPVKDGMLHEAYLAHMAAPLAGGRMNRINDVGKRKRMARTAGEMETLFKDCHIWHKGGELHYNQSMMENHLDNALYELELAYQNSGGGTGYYITDGLRTLMVETLSLKQSVEVKQ